jgi:hypothetical protein
MRAGSNLPSIPWTERERAEFKRRFGILEALIGSGGGSPGSGSFTLDDGTATAGGVFTLDDGAA